MKKIFVFLSLLLLNITCIYAQDLETKIQEIRTAFATGNELNNDTIQLNNLLFDTGSNDLSSSSIQTLNIVLELLQFYENRANIGIDGHTDDVGDESSNILLSQDRAIAVRNFLTQNSNLDGDQIVVRGYGENFPRVPNTSEENRQLNRRVEIVLSLREDVKHVQSNIIYLKDGKSIGCRDYEIDQDSMHFLPYDSDINQYLSLYKVDYVSSVTGQDMTQEYIGNLVSSYAQSKNVSYDTKPVSDKKKPKPTQIPDFAKPVPVKAVKTTVYMSYVRMPLKYKAMNIDFYYNPSGGSVVSERFSVDQNQVTKGIGFGLEIDIVEKWLLRFGGNFMTTSNRGTLSEFEMGLGKMIGKKNFFVIPRADIAFGSGKIYLGESYPSYYGALYINETRFIDEVTMKLANSYIAFKPGLSIRKNFGKRKRGVFQISSKYKLAFSRKQFIHCFGQVPEYSDDDDYEEDYETEKIALPNSNLTLSINDSFNHKVMNMSGLEFELMLGIRIFK